MTGEVNEGVVGDTAKLMMHRLIVRMLRRDPSLLEKARIAHARQADQFAGTLWQRGARDLDEGPRQRSCGAIEEG